MSNRAHPLSWPDGWPRTLSISRVGDERFKGRAYGLSLPRVRDHLLAELRRMGADQVTISSNLELRQDGTPHRVQSRITDPGVALYFTRKNTALAMASDRYVSVVGNMRSLAIAIEGLRQLERHGGSAILDRAFQGFAALAPPSWRKPWREVFMFGEMPIEQVKHLIKAQYRTLAQRRHPDNGGSDQLMAELNVAYEEAQGELGWK